MTRSAVDYQGHHWMERWAGRYLILAAKMMLWSAQERMRTRALPQDEGRVLVPFFVVPAALICINANVAELAVVTALKR